MHKRYFVEVSGKQRLQNTTILGSMDVYATKAEDMSRRGDEHKDR